MSEDVSEVLRRMHNRYQPGQCPACGALPGHQRPDADEEPTPSTEEEPA